MPDALRLADLDMEFAVGFLVYAGRLATGTQ
jgi:hypothetical protein